MPLPLDFLLPFEGQQHCDCALVLLLPPAEWEVAQQEEGGTPDADRQQAPEEQVEQQEQRRVSLQTSSTLLSVYSEKFRCCVACHCISTQALPH